jgi:hypothetical protein
MRVLLCLLTIALTQTACAEGKSNNAPPADTPPVAPFCLPGKSGTTRLVTHYYVPLLDKYSHFTCDKMEGTCIYNKKLDQWLHNFGYEDQRLSEARCKNGYGNKQPQFTPTEPEYTAKAFRNPEYGKGETQDLVGYIRAELDKIAREIKKG